MQGCTYRSYRYSRSCEIRTFEGTTITTTLLYSLERNFPNFFIAQLHLASTRATIFIFYLIARLSQSYNFFLLFRDRTKGYRVTNCSKIPRDRIFYTFSILIYLIVGILIAKFFEKFTYPILNLTRLSIFPRSVTPFSRGNFSFSLRL